MVNVSKKYLEKRLKNRIWGDLLKQIKQAKSTDGLEKIFSRKLTPKEMTMIEKRLAIDFLLRQGVRHNEIKRRLDVSSHTISFVKNGLQR